jgi:hypothetical protein
MADFRRYLRRQGKASDHQPGRYRPRPQKRQGRPRAQGENLAKPGELLKHRVPIRVFYISDERKLSGFIQIDTVYRCGQTVSGQYILTFTDVTSGWLCLYSLLNKDRRWTFAALKDIHTTLPFPLREFHSDNGSAFLNHAIVDWRRNPVRPIPFTRSRDRKKNDNCFVEQKNAAVVREYIGYDRLTVPMSPPQLLHAHYET